MGSLRRQAIVFGLLLVTLMPSLTRAAGFKATLDRQTIRLGESVVLSLEFEGGQPDGGRINLPSVQFLEFSGGGTEQRMTFVNGRQSFSIVYRYSATPIQAGDFTIPPISVSMGGVTKSSSPLTLKVLPRSEQVEDELAFVDLIATSDEVYAGQPFRVEVHLYFQAGQVRQLPELESDGFTFTDLEHSQRQIVRNGRVYHLVVFPKLAVPVKAGKLKIGPARCPFELHVPTGRRDFFNRMQYTPRNVAPLSKPVEVNVLPLPDAGRPAGFGGAVGRFKMDVQIGPTNLVAGDPVTLEVSIAGSGVLENVSLPSFEEWENFRVYPPNSTVSYQDQANFTGIKTFEQVVVPQKADVPEVPAFQFSYFDPFERRYKTLEQPGVPLSVAPAAAANNAPVIMLAQTNQAANGPKIATQLVHIKPHVGTVVSGNGGGVWVMPGLTFVAWMVLLVRRRREEQLANDPRLRRRLQVDALLEAELKQLLTLAEKGDGTAFFEVLIRILQERLGERLDLPASAITESVIPERLLPAGVDQGLCGDLERLFDACNQARYAPSRDAAELKKLASDAEAVAGRLREVEVA